MAWMDSNLVVAGVCYLYIIFVIVLSGFLKRTGALEPASSRKFLHAMIGNLPLIMPYFTEIVYPVLVAFPFIIVTYLASPYTPFPRLLDRLGSLRELTDEGHGTGLIMYAISYTVLAYLHGLNPYLVAAGIFPMAYGDSLAALVGSKYGSTKYVVFEEKSVQGSIGMFTGAFLSLSLGIMYFSSIYSFSFTSQVLPIISVSVVTTIVEAICPRGLDNIFVPLSGAAVFLLTGGGL